MHADPDRLAQVVTNLLSNAIKFSAGRRSGGGDRAARRLVRISVRDHGPGIPDEFKPHIFEKFAQADRQDARQKGGTGLGLSIVKQIVTRLGGTVGFDDAPGGGTVFQVDLAGRDQVAEREIDRRRETGRRALLLCADDPTAALVDPRRSAGRLDLPRTLRTPAPTRSRARQRRPMAPSWSISSSRTAKASV